jgi:CHAT domain-containing protein
MSIGSLSASGLRRSMLAALAAAFALAPFPSHAGPEKPRPAAAQPLPAQTPCNTDGPQGFKDALLRHDQARQAFRTKFRTGYYARPGVLNAELLAQSPQALIEKTARAIAAIADDRTPLLLYDIGAEAGEAKTLCVWLIGPSGLMAAATTHLPKPPVAHLVRNTLRVTAMAATRAPVPRRAASATTPIDPAAAGETEALPMDQASGLLLAPPVGAKLMEMGGDRILILPVADLGAVPWPALPLGGGMLIDRMAPVVLADIDWILQELPPFEARGGGVVVGDPDLSADTKYSFQPLPSAREEADAVSMRWSSARRFVGVEASRKTVLAALPRAGGLIYFATHGVADPVNPMDGSFLALKDDHLYARDIKKLELTGRPLIVMSACQTGLGKVFNAGVFGLARAWWQAGASQIVTSLWNVDDDATRDLMIDFIGQLTSRADAPREQALRKAMLNTRLVYPDPAYWAGFSLFGLPTPSRH